MLLTSFLLLLAALALPAAPFRDLAISFKQPDGTQIEIRGSGDEFYAVFETLDGYTVVFDPVLKAYCFAQSGGDGQLASSGVEVQRGDPAALGLSRHLRVDPAIRQEQVRQRRQRWEQGMELEQRWKATKAALQEREAQPGAGSGAPNGPQPSPPSGTTTGNKLGLTLLIDFDDDPATVPQAEVFNFCNADNYTGYGNNGSVKKYYYDNSNGLLTYSNVVTIYIRVPQPKTNYDDTTIDDGTQGRLLVTDAINAMEALTNYATDILPMFSGLTVDGGSRVVACNVFFAGSNSGVWSYGLWPNSYWLASPMDLGNGKRVYRYQISNIGSALELGTFCHENGHMLCNYPDLYDYTYNSTGVGDWCLMAFGANGGSPSGSNPSQICAYLKRASGWATTTALTSTSGLIATVSAVAGPDFNHFYRFPKPGVATEYFLAECRYKTGHDAALPGSGVLIWHIDELGDNSTVNLNPNTIHNNYEATVVQADNRWDLERNRNYGDTNDLFYAGNPSSGYLNQFSDSSAPNAHWWAGTASKVKFTSFSVKATAMTFVVGDLPPAANFSASPTNGAAPLANVAFSDTSTGAITNRSWDFGDGATLPHTSATNLQHTYLNAGIYSPSLTVSGTNGTSTTNRINYIVVTNAVPVADFVANRPSGLAPLAVRFANTSSGLVTNAAWDFGEGGILDTNASAVTHTYDNVGIYSVGLTVSGPGGIGSTNKANYIVVTNGPPVASFIASPTKGTAPLLVTFTNISLGVITNALWSFGDGTTTITTDTNVLQHLYDSAGNYSVCLTVTGPYGTTTSCSNNYIVVTNPPPNVAAFGDGSFGQSTVPGQAANAIAIAAGAWHNLALRTDGKVVAWGNDSSGQCDVPATLQNAQDAVAIAAGGYHSLAIRLNGTVIAWGANDDGQTNVPVGLTGVVGVAAGAWHSVALCTDGTVLVWGDNSFGQTNQPPGLTNVTAVAAGGNHTLALKADGMVVAWGENTDAEGNAAGQSVVPLDLTNVVAIGAGEYHSLAVERHGTVVAWGDNSQGQCSVPEGLTNVVAAAGGGGHSVALGADGTVAAWGADWNGQCDLPATLTPVVGVAAGEYDTVVLLATNMPPPRLLNPAWEGQQFSVLVQTLSGRNYALEFKDSLAATNWTGVCTNAGNGALRALTDSTATGARRFYRLRQW